MKEINEKELLKAIKEAIGITGEFQDPVLKRQIQEVKEYLKGAGVNEAILKTESVIGIISRGVSDLIYGGGELSNYFKERTIQLCYEDVEAGAV